MTFRVEAIAARVTDFHRQPLAGLPARSCTPSSSSTAVSIECHITSFLRSAGAEVDIFAAHINT